MSEWKECELGHLADVKGGKRLPKGEALSELPSNHPYIRTRDITNHKIKIDELLFVPDDVFTFISNYTVEENDLIISIVGTIGLCSIIPKELHLASLTENCAKIININNEKLNEKFLFYFFVSEEGQAEIQSRNVGSTQPKLPLYNIKSIPIPLPSLREQKAIAAVLSSLDDKIDLLHRQNQTLEALAETLFRQWFVEEGSMLRSITEFVVLNPKRNLAKNSIAPYLEMANVSTVVFHPQHWFNREFKSGSKFVNGDTLLARITPCLENGKSTFVTFLDEQQVGWGSTEFIVMRSKENLHPLFSYILAKNKDFRDFAEGCLEGSSGRQRVNIDHLKNYELFLPDGEKLSQFNNAAASIMPKLNSNFIQIRTLGKLRDTLLPKLMSGEVRVKI